MRFAPLFVLAALLLPFAVAAPVRDDSSYTFHGFPSRNQPADTYYVSLCRDYLHQGPAVEFFDDCFTSGIYKETNGRAGLQVRAGVDDLGIAYAADTLLAPVLPQL